MGEHLFGQDRGFVPPMAPTIRRSKHWKARELRKGWRLLKRLMKQGVIRRPSMVKGTLS